jgi:gluconolactonase
MPLSRIPTSTLEKKGMGLERPEDVVVGRDGRVFVSERQCAVAELLPDGSFVRLGPRGGAPNGINMDRQGRILIANFGVYDGTPGPLQRFDPVTGTHETLLTEVGGRRLTASNYPVLDSAGNLWCSHSTHAPEWPDALDGRADGFIYVLRPDGSAEVVAEGLQFANGLALSPDERFLFCAQSSRGDVLRFPILPGARLGRGVRYGPRLGVVVRLKLNPRLRLPGWLTRFLGYTDGIGFDVEGNLWVCLPAANKVVAITPSQQVVTVLHDPSGRVVDFPTNVSWGGADLKDLYIGSIHANYVLKGRSPVAGAPLVHQR